MPQFIAIISLIAATLVWGFGFVLTKDSLEYMGPLTFTACRFLLGSLSLILIFPQKTFKTSKDSILKGSFLGLLLGTGYVLQTIGLHLTTNGNTAFITGLHVVLVPIFSMWILKQSLNDKILLGITCAIMGLGLLSLKDGFHINHGDVWVLGCAVVFGFHLVFLGFFSKNSDMISVTLYQIYFVGILATVASFLFETPSLLMIQHAVTPILFTGVLGSALAFLILTYVQKYLTPTQTGLIILLESVFGAYFGWLLSGETFGAKEMLGCTLMLVAMVIVQIPTRKPKFFESYNDKELDTVV